MVDFRDVPSFEQRALPVDLVEACLATDSLLDDSGVESYSLEGKAYSDMSLKELFQEADRIGSKYQDSAPLLVDEQ